MRARMRLLAGGVATCAVLLAWGLRVDRDVSAQRPERTAPDSPPSSAAMDAARGADRPTVPLPEGPEVFADSGGHPFRVVPITGLSHPWSLAFLPHGDILVTELGGTLRIIRNGVLDPQPLAGAPEANSQAWRAGLMDIAVHPRYADNSLVYFTYTKAVPEHRAEAAPPEVRDAVTLARARFDGGAGLTGVEDVFVSDIRCGGACASRIAFAGDGTIIMTIGMPRGDAPQDPSTHAGKILRLNDDGTVPRDNPFVDRAGVPPRDLRARHPQRGRSLRAPGDRTDMGDRARPDGRRRDQHHRGGQELRVAGHLVRPGIHQRAGRLGQPPTGGHGGTVHVLESVAGGGRNHHLHRRQVSGLEGEHLRGRAGSGARTWAHAGCTASR